MSSRSSRTSKTKKGDGDIQKKMDEFIEKRMDHSRSGGPKAHVIDLTKDDDEGDIDPNMPVYYKLGNQSDDCVDQVDLWEYGAEAVAWRPQGFGSQLIVRIGFPAFCIYRIMSTKQFPFQFDKETIPKLSETKLPEKFPMQLKFKSIGGVAYRGSGPEVIQPKKEKCFRFTHTYVNAKWEETKRGGKTRVFSTWECRSRFRGMNQITHITNVDDEIYKTCKKIEERSNRKLKRFVGGREEQEGQYIKQEEKDKDPYIKQEEVEVEAEVVEEGRRRQEEEVENQLLSDLANQYGRKDKRNDKKDDEDWEDEDDDDVVMRG